MGGSQGHSRWGGMTKMGKGACEGWDEPCSQKLGNFSFPLCSLSSKPHPHYSSIP